MTSRLIVIITALFLAAATLGPAMDLKDITYTTDAGKVVFSHTSHLQKKTRTTSNFRCKACHDGSKEKNRNYTMTDMEKGKSCGACHDGKFAFTVKENCEKCHQA